MKITRNISGNANVKNAEAGFRQKALFVYRTCRGTRETSLNLDHLPAGDLEVDVLEARAA